jgi:hypothetical protein
MSSKAEKIEIELKELDKLLEKKKISTKKYLDLKAKLEIQLKEKSAKIAKELTKPKILNIICPNCGSPQKEISGMEEFNCEACGKLIKLFDAEKEAENLLKELPGLMENVALERLFIEPKKFEIGNELQREQTTDFILKKIHSIVSGKISEDTENLLDDCFAILYDTHGFKFLGAVYNNTFGKILLATPLTKLKHAYQAIITIPVEKEKSKYIDDFEFWVEEIINPYKNPPPKNFSDLMLKAAKGLMVISAKKLISKKDTEKQEPANFPWRDEKNLEKRAKECVAIVKPLNELANLFAILSAYSKSDLKLFLSLPKTVEEMTTKYTGKTKEKEVYGLLSPICWANFYKGLAMYTQAYGKLLLIKKESIGKNVPITKLHVNDIISNFENAAEAFERATQNADEERKRYLDFYSHVCRGFSNALKKKTESLNQLEKEKVELTNPDREGKIIELVEVNNIDFISYIEDEKDLELRYYYPYWKPWRNQYVTQLARIIEGPRYLFFVDVHFIEDIISNIK